MDIEIDVASAEPVYEQIVRQIKQGVQQGSLSPGMALPPIRQLASDLDLNHNTVAKAYKILESHRVIHTAGQKGTFINQGASMHVESRNNQDAVYEMRSLIDRLYGKGLSVKQIQAIFRSALELKQG